MGREHFAPRAEKAAKVRRVLTDSLRALDTSQFRCLDVGASSGEITKAVADQFRRTFAVDVEYDLVRAGSGDSRGVSFLQADGAALPFGSDTIDLVICAQVYEHAADAAGLIAEVRRVLRPGGMCFFSGPNSVWPIEPHYRLPFVHWLPRGLAARYLQLARRGDSFDVRPYSYWRLRRLWSGFGCTDYTLSMLRHPEQYGMDSPALRLLRKMPTFIVGLLYFALPNYNWVLVKPREEDIH